MTLYQIHMLAAGAEKLAEIKQQTIQKTIFADMAPEEVAAYRRALFGGQG
jgi:hypothetical protein